MQAMILAAGEGARMRPLTNVCPKPMLPIAGRPLIEHTLDWLYRYGVRDAAINLHYLPDVITGALGSGSPFGMRLRYSFEQRLLGTAGALRQLRGYFDRTFVLVYGDLLVDIDLTGLLAFHRRNRAQATIALKRASVPKTQSMVEVDYRGRVTRLADEPERWEGTLAHAGLYILEPEVLDAIPAKVPCDFVRDLFPALLASGAPVYAQEVWGYLLDINSHAAYARAQEDWSLGTRALAV
jgi:NDP-sugar pyrophosphorylase family protein